MGDPELLGPALQLSAHWSVAGEDTGDAGLGDRLQQQIGGLARDQAAHEQAVPVEPELLADRGGPRRL